ncbi:MAG: preprotein translocase subunit SecA [Deltaproteobacteria bacterium]|nr:preprotein translocase subunit SecA [Deltaproteobacteria bacterium]
MFGFVKKIIGTKNERELKRLWPRVHAIGAHESELKKLSDEELKAKTADFRQRLANGAPLDSLLHEAFAVVREAGWRVLKMRHFDVQLIGGMILNRGAIAEMKTGEGKTLVATLPVYLNALEGKGVHVVTVNDYLAKRDSEWMGRLYRFLGMEVGVVVHEKSDAERRQSYNADIVYGQNNEFGFDYLRDNMKESLEHYVQRDLNFAIVDEVDSILIDEARTPLIISGPAEESSEKYQRANTIIPKIKRDVDYNVDEKHHSATLTDEGTEKVQKLLGCDNLYDPKFIELLHHVNQALKAHTLYKNEVHYVVKEGEVIIVDEFTGRLMPGRRWSDGLHQAVEAKEGVVVQNENQTLATISFQNYFRLYKKLAGMTGTADTEATEFAKIYNLEVAAIPTNKPMVRKDHHDIIFKSEREKFDAIIREIQQCNERGQPVLVGTISIEKSELLARMLGKRVPHNVLNAKHHEREAEIVAQAGRYKAVTISTNMAGRGTDIVLGGNAEAMARAEAGRDETTPEFQAALAKYAEQCAKERESVVAAGGLHILGTERHEARRIDNQLRGRSGRQGDPGSSRFFLSLEDDLMRIFGGDRLIAIMERLGMEEGEQIEHRMVTKSIENAQKRVEGNNFEMRKNTLEYDDVMNQQRKAVYELRKRVLLGEVLQRLEHHAKEGHDVPVEAARYLLRSVDPAVREKTLGCLGADSRVDGEKLKALIKADGLDTREMILDVIEQIVRDVVATRCPEHRPIDDWDVPAVAVEIKGLFGVAIDLDKVAWKVGDIEEAVYFAIEARYNERETEWGAWRMRHVERWLYLNAIDVLWKDHLLGMDHLREGIHLRSYGQKDPKQEYKREGYEMFQAMMTAIRQDVARKLFTIQLSESSNVEEQRPRREQRMTMSHGGNGDDGSSSSGPARSAAPRVDGKKVGRNDPCPCGSGKKYKKCHGASDAPSYTSR